MHCLSNWYQYFICTRCFNYMITLCLSAIPLQHKSCSFFMSYIRLGHHNKQTWARYFVKVPQYWYSVFGLKKYRVTSTQYFDQKVPWYFFKKWKKSRFWRKWILAMTLQYFSWSNFYTLMVISWRIWSGIIVKMITDYIYTRCYMLRQRIKN